MPDNSAQSSAQPASNDAAPHPGKPLWVVGVGAGAGGLEAIQLLFGSMPADAELAFVICRRVQSGLTDPLADLLCTQTAMPVVRAADGIRLQAGHIYLVPPNARMVLLKDRLVTFGADAEDDEGDSAIYTAVSPIDVLLHSLAASVGRSAIAVILSGNDEDGVRGCASIRDHGGMVLAQHPESTEFAKMPSQVIAAELASAVAPPGAIADLIWRHVGKMRAPASKKRGSRDDDALARITALLEARFAIDTHAYRPSLVARRVRRRLALSKVETLADYVRLLDSDEAELTALHDDLLIRVTTFFRDVEAFGVLAREVVPALVLGMSMEQPLRVWVPACASGEEAYSIAMLILDQIERTGAATHLEVLASDRHEPALKHARVGRYLRDRLSNVPPELINRYMEDDGDCFKVGAQLRRHVTFVAHDILRAPAPDDIGLVSCRNLLIYLAAASREKALVTCSAALRPDGFLFLGPSEQPGHLTAGLETIHGKWRIYRKIPPPRVDDALVRLSEARKKAPAEAIEPPETDDVPPAERSTGDAGKRNYLEGVLAENQRMLEGTIDTLLASNDTLRRRNRDLRAENQRLANAHAALDDVATMIAHDLKMPLGTVRRMADQLKTRLEANERDTGIIASLQPMQHQLIALGRLIDDLLTYARQGPGDASDMQSFDVTNLLRETLTLIGLPKGVKVLIKPRSLEISTFRIPLACILRNLLGQAIERIGDADGAIRIEGTPDAHLLEVTIADNGAQQYDQNGELGLAIVRQLLDAAGGRLTMGANKSGVGHHVRFTWPIKNIAASAARSNSSQSA
ncbi:MAG: chemotaxis protein CheB [Pseudomonadota bacterium]